jgi:hypothetical protein
MHIQIVEDAQAPAYVVIVHHTDYEQTIRYYLSEQAARDEYAKQSALHNEVYIAKLLA